VRGFVMPTLPCVGGSGSGPRKAIARVSRYVSVYEEYSYVQVWLWKAQTGQRTKGVASRNAPLEAGQATQRVVREGQGGEGRLICMLHGSLFCKPSVQ